MATPTVAEIKAAYPGRVSKEDSEIQDIIDRAVRARDTIFSSRIAREGQVEGDQDDFVLYVALHMLTIEEGGEVDNESQTGGSVSYSHLQGNLEASLSETRWGRMARMYIKGGASIGVELT